MGGRYQQSWRRKFDGRLSRLGFRTYASYLESPHWTNFRARYRASSRPQSCLVCNSASVTLHHITYERLGEERLEDVVPLCWPHHDAVHAFLDEKGLGLLATAYAIISIQKQEEERAVQRAEKAGSRKRRRKASSSSPDDPPGSDPEQQSSSDRSEEEDRTRHSYSRTSCNICGGTDLITSLQLPLPRTSSLDDGRRWVCWYCSAAYVSLLEEEKISLLVFPSRSMMWESLVCQVRTLRRLD